MQQYSQLGDIKYRLPVFVKMRFPRLPWFLGGGLSTVENIFAWIIAGGSLILYRRYNIPSTATTTTATLIDEKEISEQNKKRKEALDKEGKGTSGNVTKLE